MFNYLAERISDRLIKNKMIAEEDRELYVYGFFILLSSVLFTLLNIFFGLLFGCVAECLIFYISFRFIRIFAGGYHANTETRCEIITTLSFFCCNYIIYLSKQISLTIPILCIALVCVILIFIFSPLDTPAKPLSEEEHKKYRKLSVIILFTITVGIIISSIVKASFVTVPLCLSLILEAVLISAGKIKGTVLKNEQN